MPTRPTHQPETEASSASSAAQPARQEPAGNAQAEASSASSSAQPARQEPASSALPPPHQPLPPYSCRDLSRMPVSSAMLWPRVVCGRAVRPWTDVPLIVIAFCWFWKYAKCLAWNFFIKTYRTITICITKNSSCRHLLVKNAKKTNVVTRFPGLFSTRCICRRGLLS